MRRAQQWLRFEQAVIRRMLQAQYFTDLTLRIEPLCAQWKRHSKPLAPAVWRWEGYRPRGTKGARWAMGLRAFKSFFVVRPGLADFRRMPFCGGRGYF